MTRKKDTLTEWMEESAAVRVKLLAGGGKPGLANPEWVADKTGMEIMQAMLAGELPYSAHSRDAGLRADRRRARQGDFPGHAAAQALQPAGHGAWRLVCHAA